MSDFIKDFGRYIVAKTKHLTPEQCQQLRDLIGSFDHPPLECVCIESDWPNYADTWKAVEQISNGEYQSPYNLIEQQQREIEELKAGEDADLELISNRQEKINELSATVDILRAELARIADITHAPFDVVGHAKRIAKKALEATQTTSLNAVRREAILDAIEQNCPIPSGTPDDFSDGFNGYSEALASVQQYALEKYPIDGECCNHEWVAVENAKVSGTSFWRRNKLNIIIAVSSFAAGFIGTGEIAGLWG